MAHGVTTNRRVEPCWEAGVRKATSFPRRFKRKDIMYKNTDPKFYQLWSMEQLVKELCRINQLLEDSEKICEDISKKIKE